MKDQTQIILEALSRAGIVVSIKYHEADHDNCVPAHFEIRAGRTVETSNAFNDQSLSSALINVFKYFAVHFVNSSTVEEYCTMQDFLRNGLR